MSRAGWNQVFECPDRGVDLEAARGCAQRKRESRVQQFNWERGFFRLWLLVSALLLCLGILVGASESIEAMLQVAVGMLAFSAILFGLGYALLWALRGFKRPD